MKKRKEARQGADWRGVALMLLCVACLCTGQFIWKRYDGLISLAAGFLIYGAGALAMMMAYRFGSLSVLQPINSLSIAISTVVGAIFFQETITSLRVVGIVAVMLGVLILTRGDAPA